MKREIYIMEKNLIMIDMKSVEDDFKNLFEGFLEEEDYD